MNFPTWIAILASVTFLSAALPAAGAWERQDNDGADCPLPGGNPESNPSHPGAPAVFRLGGYLHNLGSQESFRESVKEMNRCGDVTWACTKAQMDDLGRKASPNELSGIEELCNQNATLPCRAGKATPYDRTASLSLEPGKGTSDDGVQDWLNAIFQPDFHATFEFIDRGWSETQNVFTMLFEKSYKKNRPPMDYTGDEKARLKEAFKAYSQLQVDVAAKAIQSIKSKEIRTLALIALTVVQFKNIAGNNDLMAKGKWGTTPAVITVKRFKNGLSLGVAPYAQSRRAELWLGFNRKF